MHFLGPYIEPTMIRDIAEGKVGWRANRTTPPIRHYATSSDRRFTTPPSHHYIRCIP